MNKRQVKKRKKIINERVNFFNKHYIGIARVHGKTHLSKTIYKACISKEYKHFKRLKNIYKNISIAIDYSTNGKDYSVMTNYKIENRIIKVLNYEIIN